MKLKPPFFKWKIGWHFHISRLKRQRITMPGTPFFVSPVLVTGGFGWRCYRNGVLLMRVRISCGCQKNLVFLFLCVGEAGLKVRPLCFLRP
jgi:hypothetical protein